MSIQAVVAVDSNFGLGFKNQLLFRISDDLKRFKHITSFSENGDKPYVIMGRTTYESLGVDYLPNRRNIVLSRDKSYKPHYRIIVENDFNKLINYYTQSENKCDMYVIGGSQIYELFAPYLDTIHMTKIYAEASNVDTYFPSSILRDFHITQVEEKWSDEYQCKYEFITYERNTLELKEDSCEGK